MLLARHFLAGFVVLPLLAGAATASAAPPPWAPAQAMAAPQTQNWAYAPAVSLESGRCHRDVIGAAIGRADDAMIGSPAGTGGTGSNAAALLLGASGGALVGGAVGSRMDRLDQACVAQALEQAPDGRGLAWTEGAGSAHYTVTPRRSYQLGGRICRDYVTAASSAEGRERAYGTACRDDAEGWRIVN